MNRDIEAQPEQVFDPARVMEYAKPLTEEEIAALTPEQAKARLGVLKMIQAGMMTPKQIKIQRRKSKYSARLKQRLMQSPTL